MRFRRGVMLAVASMLVLAVAAPVARAQPAGIPVLDLDGKGFGHGVGLSQWGAMYMAQSGATHGDILSAFYPGTALGSAGDPEVRVSVYTAPDGRATLSFPSGGEVRSAPDGEQAPGFPVEIAPGGSVTITYDSTGYHVDPIVTGSAASTPVAWHGAGTAGAASTSDDSCIPLLGPCQPGNPNCGLGCATTTVPPSTAPPDTTTTTDPSVTTPGGGPGPDGGPAPSTDSGPAASTTGPVWAIAAAGGVTGIVQRDRRYRGFLEATGGDGPLRIINQLDVNTYLKGMGEVPGDWPVEAVASQAVVARTYALRAMAASGELCDYDLCQVYVGADRESAGQSAAVDATTGEVVTYANGLASTVYSADAGGISATPHEGFGSSDAPYPYLTTVRYDTPNPLPWHVEVALTDLANRLGYRGTLQGVSISDAGPSGRALAVHLDGTAGAQDVDGHQFAQSLGLRSTLFTPTIGTATSAPAAPDASAGAVQALPDDAAALSRAAKAGSSERGTASTAAEQRDAANREAAANAPGPLGKAIDLTHQAATWIALIALALVTMAAVGVGTGSLPRFAMARPDQTQLISERSRLRGRRKT